MSSSSKLNLECHHVCETSAKSKIILSVVGYTVLKPEVVTMVRSVLPLFTFFVLASKIVPCIGF